MFARSRTRWVRSLITLGVLLASLTALPSSSAAGAVDPDAPTLVFGAYVEGRGAQTRAEAQQGFEQSIGRRLGSSRVFERWDSAFPTEHHLWLRDNGYPMLLSVRAMLTDGTHVPWADIAAAPVGSELHTTMVGWADAVKSYGHPVMFSFNQEPELQANLPNGTAEDFKAAWRRIVSVFRDHGVTNAEYMWITTRGAFDLNSTDRRYAPHWYPGDAYVDLMGIDVYNWYQCRTGITTPWTSMADLVEGFRQFGLQHPEQGLWLAEWGSVEDPAVDGRKAAWIDDVRALFKQPGYEQFEGISYFHKTYDDDEFTCNWSVDSSASAQQSFAAMAVDPFYRAAYTTPPAQPPARVGYVGSSASSRNATTHTVAMPSGVVAGDALVLFDTINNTTYTESVPEGWTLEGTTVVNGARTRVWSRTATSQSASTPVTISVSSTAFVDLQVLAYTGTDPIDPVTLSAGAAETTSTASHTTPTLSNVPEASAIVSYWTDKSAGTTSWTPPAGQTVRGRFSGTGPGHLTHLATDSAATASGTYGGLTATADTADIRAMMWTLALAPAGSELPPEEPAEVTYVGGSISNRNARRHTVTVPRGVNGGDTLLLFDTVNTTAVTESAPAGWTLEGVTTVNGARTRVWSRTATATSAGSAVTVTLPRNAMVALQLLAYSGTAAGDGVTASAGSSETVRRAAHTTPTLSGVAAGSVVVSYWTDKSASTTTWTAPSDHLVRGRSAGSGAGHLSHLATELTTATVGDRGGVTATADTADSRAMMWTVALAPEG